MRVFLALLILGSLTLEAPAYELSDYRIPRHQVSSLVSRFNFSAGRGGTVDAESADRSANHYGNLNFSGYWLYDSENLGIEIEPFVTAEVNGWSSERRGTGYDYRSGRTPIRSEGSSNYYHQRYSLATRGIFFPTELPLGVEWTALGQANGDQYLSHGQGSSQDTLGIEDWSYKSDSYRISYTTRADAGLGWGRIRDASGLYKAHILEDRLEKLGRLTGKLSDETLRKIADLYYTRSDFFRRDERVERFFWNEVEAILKQDPAMTGELDAFALFRIAESVAPSSPVRHSGIRFSFYAVGRHSSSVSLYGEEESSAFYPDTGERTASDSSSSSRSESHIEEILIGTRLQVSFPVNWRVQITGDTKLERKLHHANAGYAWHTVLMTRYALHDRWACSHTFLFSRWDNHPLDRTRPRGQWAEFENWFSLAYYVESRVSVSGYLSLLQNTASESFPNEPERGRYKRFVNDVYAGITLNYFFKGASGTYSTSDYFPRSSLFVRNVGYPRGYSDYYSDYYYDYYY
ncbi:MAG: hypothetical protein H6508_00505 [Calditrichaeota bacterium]|nr:hypothetical protein [Calditrichota bacterium]MCB9365654.1 hypothetical protein [Calditrichota bacterium]